MDDSLALSVLDDLIGRATNPDLDVDSRRLALQAAYHPACQARAAEETRERAGQVVSLLTEEPPVCWCAARLYLKLLRSDAPGEHLTPVVNVLADSFTDGIYVREGLEIINGLHAWDEKKVLPEPLKHAHAQAVKALFPVLLAQDDTAVRDSAMRYCAKVAKCCAFPQELLGGIAPLLESPHKEARVAGLRMAATFGPRASGYLRAAQDLLSVSDCQQQAIRLIGSLGIAGRDAAPDLLELLPGNHEGDIVEALRSIKPTNSAEIHRKYVDLAAKGPVCSPLDWALLLAEIGGNPKASLPYVIRGFGELSIWRDCQSMAGPYAKSVLSISRGWQEPTLVCAGLLSSLNDWEARRGPQDGSIELLLAGIEAVLAAFGEILSAEERREVVHSLFSSNPHTLIQAAAWECLFNTAEPAEQEKLLHEALWNGSIHLRNRAINSGRRLQAGSIVWFLRQCQELLERRETLERSNFYETLRVIALCNPEVLQTVIELLLLGMAQLGDLRLTTDGPMEVYAQLCLLEPQPA